VHPINCDKLSVERIIKILALQEKKEVSNKMYIILLSHLNPFAADDESHLIAVYRSAKAHDKYLLSLLV